MRRVIESLAMAIHLPEVDGARLAGVAVESNDGGNLAVEKRVHALRCAGRNADADLFWYLDRLVVDETGELWPYAMHVNEVAGGSRRIPSAVWPRKNSRRKG